MLLLEEKMKETRRMTPMATTGMQGRASKGRRMIVKTENCQKGPESLQPSPTLFLLEGSLTTGPDSAAGCIIGGAGCCDWDSLEPRSTATGILDISGGMTNKVYVGMHARNQVKYQT